MIQPDVMEEMVVSCVIKHLNLVDALQSLINFQYQEEHAEEYDLLRKIMGETFKKLNAMERQLQVKPAVRIWHLPSAVCPGRLTVGWAGILFPEPLLQREGGRGPAVSCCLFPFWPECG